MLLMEFDKAGAEWVVVAYASGDPRMIEVIESGKSPHTVTGALISGATEEFVVKEDKLVGKNTDPELIDQIRQSYCPEVYNVRFYPRTMSIRQCGKKSNHGINYIMGPREFSLFSELDEPTCKKVIYLYTKEAYVYVPIWWDAVKRELKDNGRVITNCFGDKRRFLDRWDNQLFKAAVAYIPQSTVARCVHKGISQFWRDDCRELELYEPLGNVHDSLLFQAQITKNWKQLAVGALKIGDYMTPACEYGGRSFKILTDLKVGLNWGEVSEDNPQGMQSVKLTRDIDKLAKDLKLAWEKLNAGAKKAA